MRRRILVERGVLGRRGGCGGRGLGLDDLVDDRRARGGDRGRCLLLEKLSSPAPAGAPHGPPLCKAGGVTRRRVDTQRQVADTADGDGQPEVDEPPGHHPEDHDRPGRAETDKDPDQR